MNFVDTELHDFLRSKPLDTLSKMIKEGINSPKASSCGRLFDAVAAAVGVCRETATHEGEAAIRLEALADPKSMAAVDEELAYPFSIPNLKGSNLPYIEPAAMWQALCGDLYEHTDASVIAARFHKGLSRALATMACKVTLEGETRVINKIALSGGVFQNRVLTEDLVPRLQAEGFEVILHSQFPANDGGLSLGQAAVAAARLNLEKKD
jgi:hydrogenase maturation protein HypF